MGVPQCVSDAPRSFPNKGSPKFWDNLQILRLPASPQILGELLLFWGGVSPYFWGCLRRPPRCPPRSFPDEEGPKHWSPSRYEHVMRLRQEALEAARAMWADYLLVQMGGGSPNPGGVPQFGEGSLRVPKGP